MPLKLTPDETTGVNLTPMIDVVFLLVIFFMVATKFTELERNIELELPTTAQAGESVPPPKPRVVAVFADGHTELDGETLSLEDLTGALQDAVAGDPEVQVVIDGDARCPFQHVAVALAACREAGVSDLGVTVELAASAAAVRR